MFWKDMVWSNVSHKTPTKLLPHRSLESVWDARDQKQEMNNSVDGWQRAFQSAIGYTHPTIHKLIEFIQPEQSLAENELVRTKSREKALKTAKY